MEYYCENCKRDKSDYCYRCKHGYYGSKNEEQNRRYNLAECYIPMENKKDMN